MLTVEAERANLGIARYIWWLLRDTSLEGFLSVNYVHDRVFNEQTFLMFLSPPSLPPAL